MIEETLTVIGGFYLASSGRGTTTTAEALKDAEKRFAESTRADGDGWELARVEYGVRICASGPGRYRYVEATCTYHRGHSPAEDLGSAFQAALDDAVAAISQAAYQWEEAGRNARAADHGARRG